MTLARVPRIVLALVLVLAASSVTAVYRMHHDAARWPPDTAIYLRMALQDRGLSREAARDEANRFMLTTRARTDPDARGFYGPDPPIYYVAQFDLFRSRPLYPRLGALLYPRFGPHGLQLISACAYVFATLLVFGVLLLVVPEWLAAIGALAFATAPPVLDMTGIAMTDELGLAFWIATLGAVLLYQRRPTPAVLAAVVLTTLALAFTRPAIYLPVGAALGAWFAARRIPGNRDGLALLLATAGGAVVFLVYSAAVHGPGLVEQLRWQYEWSTVVGDPAAMHGFAPWYAHSFAAVAAEALTYDVYKNGALFTLVLAVLGAVAGRRTRIVPVLLGAACAAVVPLLVNPTEFVRTVELPLTPIVIVLATMALASTVRSLRTGEAPGTGLP